jgi:hypothetical protein
MRTSRPRYGIRLRILLGGLIALSIAHFVAAYRPSLVGGAGDDWGTDRPLESCITEKSVREFLDGKTILSRSSRDAGGNGLETITLHKEQISSLKTRADDYSSIVVRFNLDHEGKRCFVQGFFEFTTSEDPSLHIHGWDRFMGQVVSGQ